MVEFAVTEEYQAKVLAMMLHDIKFRNISAGVLKPEYFANKALGWFFNTLSNQNLTETLLREELIGAAKSKSIKQDEVPKYLELFNIIKVPLVPAEEAHIREKLSAFVKTQAVKNAMVEAISLTKEQQWEEIVSIMSQAVKSDLDFTDMGKNYFLRIEDRIAERAVRERDKKILTCIPEFDEVLNGGIKHKQVGLIVGGTGRGKSIMLQWLARSAILTGKKALYVTCELSEESIEDRFDAMLAKVKPQLLNDLQAQVLSEVAKYRDTYGDSLIIKHYPADQATVHTIKNLVEQLTHAGMKPDLVIIDYLDLLRPHRTYNSSHEETDAIMKAVVGFAAEYDIAIWTASQLNRSGMVAETPDEASMAGYVGKQYAADIVTWLAQTKEEREDQQIRLWVSKNRNGAAGRSIPIATDYGYMTFYRESNVTADQDDSWTDGTQDRPDLQLLLEESEEN